MSEQLLEVAYLMLAKPTHDTDVELRRLLAEYSAEQRRDRSEMTERDLHVRLDHTESSPVRHVVKPTCLMCSRTADMSARYCDACGGSVVLVEIG